eukprot:gene9096-1399_t
MEKVRNLLKIASDAAQKACEFDEAAKHADAIALYDKASHCILQALSLNPMINKGAELQKRALSYTERASLLRQKVPQKAAHEKKEHGLRVNLSKDQPANLPSSAGTDAREIESAKLEHRADSIYSAARDYHLEHKLFQAEKAYLQAAEVYIQARKLLENMADRRRIEEKTDKALRGAEKLKSKHSVDGEVCASLPQPPKPKAATPAKSVQFKQSVPSEKPSLVPAHVVRDGHGERLTSSEKEVLKFASRVNDVMYVPWTDSDATDDITNGLTKFKDGDGLLRLAPKQKGLAEWKRPSQFCTAPVVVNSINSRNIKQTVISDCSFVSSLAISADFEQRSKKRLITKGIFPQDGAGNPIYNRYGKYVVKLHFNGCWRRVIIDDRLPVCSVTKEPLCSYSADRNELWVSILEKAYMKVMGGYDFPGSNSSVDLHALTGWIPDRLPLEKCNDVEWKRLWEGLHGGKVLMTVATGNIKSSEADRAGLVPTHAYAILDMRDLKGVRLVKLKNPWRHLRWKGRYSPYDTKSWTPSLQKALQYDVEDAQKNDDGEFWIDWPSLNHFFDIIYINWNPERFPYSSAFHDRWNQEQGPVKDLYNMQYNPQFKLLVKSKKETDVWILLSRHITRIDDFADNKEYITVHVYRSMNRIMYPEEAHIQGVKINSPHYLAKLRVPPGEQHYALVVSQYEKANTIRFTLKVYSGVEFKLERMPHRYSKEMKTKGQASACVFMAKWTADSAGGCQNNPQLYARNPMFSFKTPSSREDTVPVLIKLEGPRVYSVGLCVFTDHDQPVSDSGGYRPGFCKVELELPPNTTYHVVPATFNAGEKGPFFLTVASTSHVEIKTIR